MNKKIQRMVGRAFKHNQTNVTIDRIDQDRDMYVINFSDGSTARCDENELMNDFIPVVNLEISSQQKQLIQSTANTFEQMDKLTDVLMNTINKVQSDPSYTEQAKSINDSVKQIVDINKTKIDAMKLLKEMNQL